MRKGDMWLLITGLLIGALGNIGSARGQAIVTLEQVGDIMREDPALNVTRLWQYLGIVPQLREGEEGKVSLFGFSPDQDKPWMIEAGTWEYSVFVPEPVSGVQPDCPEVKVIRIRNNRWDHQMLLFRPVGSHWEYSGNISFFDQKSKEPCLSVYDRGDGSCIYLASRMGQYGLCQDAEIVSFYRLSEKAASPVLTVLKDGYVRGGESMSDRRYQAAIESQAAGPSEMISITYTVSYYGDSLGYSYDYRFTDQPPAKMLLSSVEKKACFLWDENSQNYLFDEENSSLAEEDKTAVLNR